MPRVEREQSDLRIDFLDNSAESAEWPYIYLDRFSDKINFFNLI